MKIIGKKKLVVIVGPTAGGKSELAAALAEALGGEVISADSMQVYRQMDAGTAKPPRKLREKVAHHLIDVVEPVERFTVADWLGRAEGLIEGMKGRGVRPIVVGGTNLYIKALLEGMFEGPGIDEVLREELAKLSGEELHRRLELVDSEAAGRIHRNDRKKLVRALEVFEMTGRPISAMQTQWGGGGDESEGERSAAGKTYRHDPVMIGLEWGVEVINRRINARVKGMFFPQEGGKSGDVRESLPEEVRRLEAAGLLGPQAREALGYKQVLASLRGECTMEEAFEETKILTRRFGKTQRTWLRRYRGVYWLKVGEGEVKVEELTERAMTAIDTAGNQTHSR